MHRITVLCFVGLLVAGAMLAEDFWIKKDYMQWTNEEVKKLLTDSPWAKDFTLTVPMASLVQSRRGAETAAVGAADVEAPSTGRRGGRSTNTQAGAAEVTIALTISWRSALPMRKALVRSRLGPNVETIPPEAEQLISKDQQDYVIVLTGVPIGQAKAIQNLVLLEKSTVRAGKKPPITPTHIDMQPRTQTVDVIFTFPRSRPITIDDKEVEVSLNLGPIEAKKKFNLKDMVYNAKLEL